MTIKQYVMSFLSLIAGCLYAWHHNTQPKQVYIIGCQYFDPKLILELYNGSVDKFYQYIQELDFVQAVTMHMHESDLFVCIKEQQILARTADNRAIGIDKIFAHRMKFIKNVLLTENCTTINPDDIQRLNMLKPLLSVQIRPDRWDIITQDKRHIKLNENLDYSIRALSNLPVHYKSVDLRKAGWIVVKTE